MEIKKLAFSSIPQLSQKDIAYVEEDPLLSPFYKYPVRIENFQKVIDSKKQDRINRKLLVDVLKDQYSKVKSNPFVDNNIQKLASTNTFTVLTAHQPSLFTGPLYYIYKIISTINLASSLSKYYPDYQFVPMFVSGGEDHDFEEVNHVNIFNNRLVWENGEQGSVGMMKTATLKKVLSDLKEILGESENGKKVYKLLEKTHTGHQVYSDAVFEMVHEIFEDHGLVVLNMNNSKLKAQFIPIIKEEIIRQTSHALVEETAGRLDSVGFKQQATPREINFFYLRDQVRERIVFEDGVYKVLNSDYTFSESEMESEIEKYPQHFSPNVIMRPLFQESVLPNLAYIGGGGEIAYWIERKSQFEHFKVSFPMLVRRDSVMWIDSGISKKMEKLGLEVEDLFQDTDSLIKQYIRSNADESLHLNEQKQALKDLYDSIVEKVENIDPTLKKPVLAEHSKALKTIEQLESRIIRAEKQRHEVAVNQIRAIKEKLFPNNGLQERHDNLISFYFKYGSDFFKILFENLNPLDRKFVVIRDK